MTGFRLSMSGVAPIVRHIRLQGVTKLDGTHLKRRQSTVDLNPALWCFFDVCQPLRGIYLQTRA
jgi:hypothetical protein